MKSWQMLDEDWIEFEAGSSSTVGGWPWWMCAKCANCSEIVFLSENTAVIIFSQRYIWVHGDGHRRCLRLTSDTQDTPRHAYPKDRTVIRWPEIRAEGEPSALLSWMNCRRRASEDLHKP